MHRTLLFTPLALLSSLALFACKATTTTPSGSGGQGGAGASGGTTSQGGNGAFGGVGGFGGLGGSGGGCGLSCTADLKKVIDCNGVLVKECGSDQGCANGQCIDDPCEAAKLSSSSLGCDYWALKTDIISDATGACFAAFVANTWTSPVKIQVDYKGATLPVASFARIPSGQGQGLTYAPYDPAVGLPPGEVAILFLARNSSGFGFLPNCPVPAALSVDGGISGTGIGDAFHITTDRPVVAYQILPYGGGSSAATSATLLLPTSVWDTNYVAINAYPASQIAPAYPSLNVLAHEDGTEVTILPKVAIQGGNGVPSAAANTPATYLLNRGNYLQITQGPELSGSPIQSNKPVGVWGGASCLNVPVTAYACDSAQQQIPPVKAMGNEYVGVRYRGRGGQEETPPWRIIGMVDGTSLTYEPAPPPGAPQALSLGQVFEFNTAGPFIVRSQDADHPFYVAAYMTGGEQFNGEGDPEWVNVIPAAQYLDSYVLFTDPTYSETELVMVRRPSKDGNFADVFLDCLGPVGGWQPIGPYQWTRVDLVTGNFQNVGNCSNGRHELKSELPFGVTVWGWGSNKSSFFTEYVSYAYPAGASVAKINEVVVEVPEPN